MPETYVWVFVDASKESDKNMQFACLSKPILEIAIKDHYVANNEEPDELSFIDFLPPPRQAGWGIPEET